MDLPERHTELEAWDWLKALRDQERSIPWLARKTDRADMTVYRYASGNSTPPRAWLESAARVLGVEFAEVTA